MTDDKFYTSLSANNIMAKLTNHVQRTRLITPSTDKHYSLDSEDDFRSGCRNVSHQQQFFSELLSPGRSHNTNYWYSWVQTIYYITILNALSVESVWTFRYDSVEYKNAKHLKSKEIIVLQEINLKSLHWRRFQSVKSRLFSGLQILVKHLSLLTSLHGQQGFCCFGIPIMCIKVL